MNVTSNKTIALKAAQTKTEDMNVRVTLAIDLASTGTLVSVS